MQVAVRMLCQGTGSELHHQVLQLLQTTVLEADGPQQQATAEPAAVLIARPTSFRAAVIAVLAAHRLGASARPLALSTLSVVCPRQLV